MFVGPRAALRPFVEIAPGARVYGLTPAASLFALPLTDDVHDALHAAYGTGEWLDIGIDQSPRLTTTDIAFAAAASRRAALVWLETCGPGGEGCDGGQIAAAWIDGSLEMKPSLLRGGEHRPVPLRPVNTALRMLGVTTAGSARDEAAVLGLSGYRSLEAIAARAALISPV